MFGKAKLYERLLEERDRHIALLAAELDRLRGGRTLQALDPPDTTGLPDGEPAVLADGDWVSEAEEAQKIVDDLGLSAVHLPEILEGLGLGTSDLS